MQITRSLLLALSAVAIIDCFRFLPGGRMTYTSSNLHIDRSRSMLQSSFGSFNRGNSENSESMSNQVPRSEVPSRYDVCKVLVSGIIGIEPKEAYLSNGHYVLNCAVAVIGHYDAVHDWEKFKPTETMWVNVEVWDDLAKTNIGLLQKGSYIRGVARLIVNKWKDKQTGEEKKQFRLRLTKLLSEDQMSELSELLGDDAQAKALTSSTNEFGTSGFGNDSPAAEDQTAAPATAAPVFAEDFPRGTVGNQNQYYQQRPPSESTLEKKAWQPRAVSASSPVAAATFTAAASAFKASTSSNGSPIATSSIGRNATTISSGFADKSVQQQQQQQQPSPPQKPVWGMKTQQSPQQQGQPQQQQKSVASTNDNWADEESSSNSSDGEDEDAPTTFGSDDLTRWWHQ